MTTWTALEERLRARREELVRRMDDCDRRLGQRPDPDDEDRALEMEDDEVLEDLGIASQTEIRAIDHALARIADGTYGTCESCGEPIAPARLEAVPYTSLCRNCA